MCVVLRIWLCCLLCGVCFWFHFVRWRCVDVFVLLMCHACDVCCWRVFVDVLCCLVRLYVLWLLYVCCVV